MSIFEGKIGSFRDGRSKQRDSMVPSVAKEQSRNSSPNLFLNPANKCIKMKRWPGDFQTNVFTFFRSGYKDPFTFLS